MQNNLIKSALREQQQPDIKDEIFIQQMKVLIVNDEFFILEMLKQIIEQTGIKDIDQA